jgi:DNA polymerase I-like protein with 3'-5' exonuclease and polymerase domains
LTYFLKTLPNSPKQVKTILEELGFSVSSTATSTLKRINHPFPRLLIEYRKLSKQFTSFANSLPTHINQKTNRIHQNIFQIGTQTGRTSSSNPNLQQMPKEQEWRDLFVAKQGYKIITADYAQIELRILSEYSQDRTFIDVFNRGEDLHSNTAANIFRGPLNKVSKIQRDMAKTINFGICYGMTPKGLADQLNISIKKAKMAIDSYFDAYPQIKPTLEWLGERARDDGFSVTINGRNAIILLAKMVTAQGKGKTPLSKILVGIF